MSAVCCDSFDTLIAWFVTHTLATLRSFYCRAEPRMRSVGLTVIALVCISLRTPAEAATLAAWVQLGPRGEVSARVITNDSACPTLRMDGAPLPMKARSDPEAVLAGVSKASFPVRGCEAVIAPGAQALLLDDRPLPLPRRELRRVVILGDTGCRLKGAFAIQDCNDPNAWPYAKIVAHAVAARPDLVIHLGDYHYRETACPAGWRGCEGSPFGFGWDAWNADFFAPSAPLFAAAPWLLVRGNHEDCERAGEGWFRLLAAVSLASRCGDLTGFFVTETGGMGFVVMDSASATDPSGDPQPLLRKLAAQFAEIRDTIPGESWLLTHRPMNALRSSPAGPDSVENRIQQAAIGDALPPSVRMIVSGHNHFFQALDFDGVRAPQLVVGTGGDVLLPIPREQLIGKNVNGARVADAATRFGFAYMVWDRAGVAWEGALFDENGRPAGHCTLVERRLSCS